MRYDADLLRGTNVIKMVFHNMSEEELTALSEMVTGTSNNGVRFKKLSDKLFGPAMAVVNNRKSGMNKMEEVLSSLAEYSLHRLYNKGVGIDWTGLNKDILKAMVAVGAGIVEEEVVMPDELAMAMRGLLI